MQKIILLEIISGFGIDVRYKISIQKKWHFNTLSRNVQSKFLKIIYICIKKINILGMNTIEIDQYYYNENYSIQSH